MISSNDLTTNVASRRLLAAAQKVRDTLLAQRQPQGHWVGRLSSSALSTATAVSALAVTQRYASTGDGQTPARWDRLIVTALRWLAQHQNPDGGWGDTPRCLSNIATTMLVRAAFHLTGLPGGDDRLLERAESYIQRQGGIAALRRRYGRDKTFSVPILTNCALAGLVPWREVSSLPFELACFPQHWYPLLRLPVVSYAIPALVAVGQARFYHRPPLNPLARWLRRRVAAKSLEVAHRMQPASGGFLEATPLTSFVVMSLASVGQADHPLVRRGVDFLVRSAHADGSWPIDTNLATWNTTLSINALAAAGEEVTGLDCLPWLLDCQHTQPHPFTGAQPGGWAWTDLSGGVPDVDDTAGALLALSHWLRHGNRHEVQRVRQAGVLGVDWLLDLQNADGGWPTFCRGWGKLPFDRSATDLTAHALRALSRWRETYVSAVLPPQREARRVRLETAIERGLNYLAANQKADGRFLPLWFGNQYEPDESNPIYGTAKVLLAYRDLDLLHTPPARRALAWLAVQVRPDGGFGGGPADSVTGCGPHRSSVEETALAVEALLCGDEPAHQAAASRGLEWLVAAVEDGSFQEASPIGFYFAKLWYDERLYPLIFSLSALGEAAQRTECGRMVRRPASPASL